MARRLRNEVRLRSRYERAGYRRTNVRVEVSGMRKIFREKASAGRWDRPESLRLLDQMRKGDIFIVVIQADFDSGDHLHPNDAG